MQYNAIPRFHMSSLVHRNCGFCCNMADVNVMADWSAGLVPHVVPERPYPCKQWSKVPAGPDRLSLLMKMWVDGLPGESREALREFVLLG